MVVMLLRCVNFPEYKVRILKQLSITVTLLRVELVDISQGFSRMD